MPKKYEVTILTSNGCHLCGRAKLLLKSAAVKSGVELTLKELSIDLDDPSEAVDYAIAHNLENVPSFKIGNKVFVDDKFSEEDLILYFKKVVAF